MHGGGFNPTVRFDLNYDPLSTDTQLVDATGTLTPVNTALYVASLGEII